MLHIFLRSLSFPFPFPLTSFKKGKAGRQTDRQAASLGSVQPPCPCPCPFSQLVSCIWWAWTVASLGFVPKIRVQFMGRANFLWISCQKIKRRGQPVGETCNLCRWERTLARIGLGQLVAVNVTQKLPCTRYSPSPMQPNLTASMVLVSIVTFESSELLLSPNWIEDECQNRLVLIRFVADHSVSYTHRLPRHGAGGGTQGGPQTGHPQNLGLCSKGQNAWVFLLVPQRGLLSGFPFFFAIFLFYGILIIFLAIPCVKASQFVYYI